MFFVANDAVEYYFRAYALDREFAGGIKLGHHHFVGQRQRFGKLGGEIACARVEMRLKGHGEFLVGIEGAH